MKIPVEIDPSELELLYSVLEDINELFHQPLNYQDSLKVEAFAARRYGDVHKLYYDIVWRWLPDDVKTKYVSR